MATCLTALGWMVHSANASLVAAYPFNDTLASVPPGDPSLVAVDPLHTSAFQSANIFGNTGNTKETYHFDGNVTRSDQGGLTLNTSSFGDLQ